MNPNWPIRTKNHQIDTLAMKKVSLMLGSDLLIRSVDERDYGVDALVESFSDSAIAQILLFQVKGTESEIHPLQASKGGTISLGGFPRRTVAYAEEFVHPFIVAYTSVKDGPLDKSPIYYLWLQRYIEYSLEVEDPGWRQDSQDTMTLYIPTVNTISGENKRIKNIAASSMFLAQSNNVIRATARLQALIKDKTVDIPYLLEVAWILSAIKRSPMIVDKLDTREVDIKNALTLTRDALLEAQKSNQAYGKLTMAIGALERRMSTLLATLLLIDTNPADTSW
ncbi:DUF4365 domain-containing protein [Herbaspirillum lusitanum]|uniref:DUF4365 domain-containing protein n=1 Tax=Herbaspirillum lusitanum TaxID=213312 RepID=UPI0012F4AEB2|nr:DUF4365 domain-containing protein [Herbaspirillum lusitanum]